MNAETDAAVAVPLEKFGDDQRREVIADRQRRADVQCSVAGLPAQQRLDVLGAIEELHRARQQPFAQLVQADGFADAVEQLHVELALELRKSAACRRLRHREGLGGA